ncbi:MAG: Uma2 family endonuclease [Mycobacteriales bacterium]
MTWDDIQAMPDDSRRYESVAGVLTLTPAPGLRHQLAAFRLARLLDDAAPDDLRVLLAPYDWWISQTEWYEPDVVVFRRAEATERRLEVAPLLVIEVASPSTRLHDLNDKKAAYAANGCPHYWVVDPDEPSVLEFRLGGSGREGYEKAARVVGTGRFETTEPFAVGFSPAQLVAD